MPENGWEICADPQNGPTHSIYLPQEKPQNVLLSLKLFFTKIKLLNKGNAIDKIYIVPLAYGSTPTGKGFDFTDAPFITVHSQVHKLDVNNYPTKLLCVYSSLNTFRDIILDDWYNFNLSFLSGELEEVWSGDYAVVLFSSGSNKNRYVMWDTFPNDEYVHEPSIIKIKEN